MIIGVLTSTHRRHIYFANYLVSHLPVSVVVSEQKSAEPREVGLNASESKLLQNYFDERERTEIEMLPNADDFIKTDKVEILRVGAGAINNSDTIHVLESRGIDTLAVFGTGLLKEPLLSSYSSRIVNIHLGVSPYYRGSATNFWAMYNEDLHLVGSTIHFIDAGVDTGDIICHVLAIPKPDDSPHEAGIRIIQMSVVQMSHVLRRLAVEPVPTVKQWIPEKAYIYRRSDFTAQKLLDFLTRWNDGMVRRRLPELSELNARVELVQLD